MTEIKEKEPSVKTFITDKQLDLIKKLQKELKNTLTEEKLMQYVKRQYGVDDLHKLTRTQGSDLIYQLLETKKEEGKRYKEESPKLPSSGKKGG